MKRLFEASLVKTDEKSQSLMLQETTKRTQDPSPEANLKGLKVTLIDASLRTRHKTLLLATEARIIQNFVRNILRILSENYICKYVCLFFFFLKA